MTATLPGTSAEAPSTSENASTPSLGEPGQIDADGVCAWFCDRLVLENVRRVVEGSGANLANTVSCRVSLSNLSPETFKEMNAVYDEYFGGDQPPARATVGTQLLGFDVEIECVVALEDK